MSFFRTILCKCPQSDLELRAALTHATLSQQQKDPALPCPAGGLLLPPRDISPTTMGRSKGRLSIDSGRWQSPCPGTQPPALKESPGHPGVHTHIHTPAAIAGRRDSSCPVPPMVQQGIPDLEPVLFLCTGERSHRLWAITSLREPSRNCSCIALLPETYRVKGCEDVSSSELSSALPLQTAFKLSLSHLSPPAVFRTKQQPCCTLQRSCFWAELSLCGAAHLP